MFFLLLSNFPPLESLGLRKELGFFDVFSEDT